jgi:hypothetical protein
MRALTTRRFTRDFSKVRHEALTVTDRGKPIGTWQPAARKPKRVDFAQRARQDFKTKLPFTFAELLKEGKKR